MIFVTVGAMRAFDRLVREMDRIAGGIGEEVIMQIGAADYKPQNCNYFRFSSRSDMEKLYSKARLVVCHAGIGSILTAMKYNKSFVLVPRMKRYGEVFDDHQLEIAAELQSRGITAVYDINELEYALDNVSATQIEFKDKGNLVSRLKEYLEQLDKELKSK